MKIEVKLPINSYDILIENDFKSLFIKNKKALIVTDSNVSKLYANMVLERLVSIGIKAGIATFDAGEKQKNLNTIQDLYKECVQAKLDRKSCIIALGGGVCGDMAGFTAATFMRGIDYIQIPTSLLAQCDSSVGGKTGVDFLNYKNIIGAFHQPKQVYINLSVLKTLDKRQFCAGMAEVIKHGIICDYGFLEFLNYNKEKILNLDEDIMSELIAKNCMIKSSVVSKDEKEQGLRAILNFGHTLGHAIESFYEFSYLHGECVAIGIIGSLYISKLRGLISEEEVKMIRDLLQYFNLEKYSQNLDVNKVYSLLQTDKKVENETLKFVLADRLGSAKIYKDVTKDEITAALSYIKDWRV